MTGAVSVHSYTILSYSGISQCLSQSYKSYRGWNVSRTLNFGDFWDELVKMPLVNGSGETKGEIEGMFQRHRPTGVTFRFECP